MTQNNAIDNYEILRRDRITCTISKDTFFNCSDPPRFRRGQNSATIDRIRKGNNDDTLFNFISNLFKNEKRGKYKKQFNIIFGFF